MNYHIGRIVLGSVCVGDSVWLDWSGIRVAGFSLKHGIRPTLALDWTELNVDVNQASDLKAVFGLNVGTCTLSV